MKKPTTRFTGPLPERDATILLALCSFLITVRAPMSFVLLAVGSMAVVVVQGLRRGTGLRLRPLWALLGSMLACSFLSVVLFHRDQLASSGSSLAGALVMTSIAAAALLTGRPRRGVERLMDGIFAGLLFHWGLSMFEAFSGIKMLPILYPTANTVAHVKAYRFFVTSNYPNYNDYSVAMTLLVTLIVARMLYRNAVAPWARLARWVVLLTAVFEVAYMGSRGCLIAMAAAVGLLLLHNVRSLHPGVLGVRTIAFGVMFVATAAAGVLISPWFQDSSTAQRGIIAGNIRKLVTASPADGLLGFGSMVSYQRAAERAFGDRLMDPHNLLLEILVVFGLPSLMCYLACWWSIVRRDLVSQAQQHDWRSIALAVIVAIYPLVGVVSSSTLRYYLVWTFLIIALGRRAAIDRDGWVPNVRPGARDSRHERPVRV